jgi:methylglutaconyl-CoA hydratase/polyketide biosynthesis enoyl-CoA hydratase PksH
MELITKAVQYETISGVAHITLLSPKSGNALTIPLIKALIQSIKQAVTDESCRAIVIAAEGADFCKGLDLEAVFCSGDRPDPNIFKMFLDCLYLISTCSLPVIACVEGNVTGGGAGLVAACDLVLATENVVFMLSEVIVGMIPALITPFLLRRMTLGRVKYMTLSTRGINALEAKDFGLVDEVATDGMSNTLNRQLQRLFRSSPRAIAESKQLFAQLDSGELHRQMELDLNHLLSWLEQPEVVEGVRTFAEGFSPPWFKKYRG